jgi:hypothetical protein
MTQFITSGVTPEERARIGPLPEGHGLLGELIRERAPLLIAEIAADPRSVGFPPHHPPMRSLLGAPILLGDRVLGNLYLTERTDGEPFDGHDLTALQVLATHAAAAIDRAHAYRRAEEQRDQLRVILDNLPAGVMILAAPEARVELANATAVEMVFGPAPCPARSRSTGATCACCGRTGRRRRPSSGWWSGPWGGRRSATSSSCWSARTGGGPRSWGRRRRCRTRAGRSTARSWCSRT